MEVDPKLGKTHGYHEGSHVARNEKAISLPNQVIADLVLAPTRLTSNAHVPGSSYITSMWVLLVMCIIPAAVGLLWFVAVPLSNTYSPYFREKALFIFFTHPGT